MCPGWDYLGEEGGGPGRKRRAMRKLPVTGKSWRSGGGRKLNPIAENRRFSPQRTEAGGKLKSGRGQWNLRIFNLVKLILHGLAAIPLAPLFLIWISALTRGAGE